MKLYDHKTCLDFLVDKVVELDKQLNKHDCEIKKIEFENDMLRTSLKFYQSLLRMNYSPVEVDSWI